MVQKKVNNAVDRLKQAVKGKKNDNTKKTVYTKDNAENSYKNKNNNYRYSYNNNQRTDFNDYPQRNYNCDKLEELLLYGKGSLSECEI